MAAQAPPPVAWIEDELPEELRARIKAELEPGERLVWADRAIRAGTALTKRTSLITLALWSFGSFSIFGLILGFAAGLFGTPRRPGADAPFFLVTIAVVSGLVGLGTGVALIAAIVERIQSWSSSGQAAYALTDRRAILWCPRKGSRAVAVFTSPSRSLLGLHRIEYPDGSGDVLFQEEKRYPWDSRGFLGIANVRRVESLARPILVDPDPRRNRERTGDLEFD